MTNKKSTKRALIASVISLLLCFTMLMGTTYAWFTDSVTSANNIITTGNLDVELEYFDGAKWEKVTATTNVFEENTLWEPGHTEVVYLKVSNAGTLALKYQLGVNVASEVTGTNLDGDTIKLSDIIVFGAVENQSEEFANREAAREAVVEAKKLSEGYSKSNYILPNGDPQYVALVVYMPETVGNEANYKTGTAAPTINLGINLFATQYTSEDDSFGPDYDEDATYLPAWDGEAGEVPEEVDGVITISTPAELAALANDVNVNKNSYAGKTVKLASDLNLGNKAWTPIGQTGATEFKGVFDGQGYTIYNMTVNNTDTSANCASGLFGWIESHGNENVTVKNVKFDNANVSGHHNVAVVAGYIYGTIENCVVTNSTVIATNANDDANGDKVGAIAGYVGDSKLVGNKVENCVIIGNRDVGGLAGVVHTGVLSFKNNSVIDTKIAYITDRDYASAGEITSGRTGYTPDETNTATNVTISKGELVAEGVVGVGTRSYEVLNKAGLLNVNKIIAESGTGEGKGIKVKLLADVDLAGETWTPIDKMWIEFDGNGHTISNLKTEAWKAGFFGYLGGGSIKNLTLENVDVTGAQAGIFAGSVEGTIDNCYLKGTNTVTYAEKHQYDDPNANIETWGGIGAITGVIQPSTINVEIVEGATVTLDYGTIKTEAAYVDELTGYISANKGTVINNGSVNVKKTVADASDLAAMLTQDAKEISITLADDVEVPITSLGQQTPGSGEYKLGGENTTAITIDMNGNKLTISTSYWSALGAKNPDATMTIKNGSMTSSQASGTWNSYDLRFANCNVVLEDVVFDKAIALENAGKNATLKNVTINETHDYYALWITAEGQNVVINGLTINSAGRGIKIDEQYVGDDVAKVNLSVSNATFTTVNKAAILVKSAAGADITLENVDIKNVTSDTTNAVWVDADASSYSNLVTVTGGAVMVEQ